MPKNFDWITKSGVAPKSPELVDTDRPPASDELARFVPQQGQLRESAVKRPSGYKGLLQQAVCNDDGDPLLAETNALLRELLAEIKALRAER